MALTSVGKEEFGMIQVRIVKSGDDDRFMVGAVYDLQRVAAEDLIEKGIAERISPEEYSKALDEGAGTEKATETPEAEALEGVAPPEEEKKSKK